MQKLVNWDYIKQVKDPYLFFKTFFISKNRFSKKFDRVLIVNPCLVGDFIVSLPALSSFIKNNRKLKVDLIVTPPLKKLAQNIKGVRKVFVSSSSTFRDIEKIDSIIHKFPNYDEVIVMRISNHSYNLIKKVKMGKIKTPLVKFFKYSSHSIVDVFAKRKPIQRREIDFDILGQKFSHVAFEDIFDFDKKDYQRIRENSVMKTKDKIIIIHIGPVWIMRKWDNNKWTELIRKINSLGKFRFIFVGSKEAELDYKEIASKLDFKVYSFINKIDIMDLMLVLRLSNYLIGVDSGPRNMAHLADLRSITLFGPAASGAIYMPWDKKDIIIDKSNGGGLYQALFYKKNKFIDKISAEEVFKAFKKLMRISKNKTSH